MKYLFFFLVLTCGVFTQCNKVIEEVPQPPFSAFPNPFVDVFSVSFGPNVPATAELSIRLTDSKDTEYARLENVNPNSPLSFNLEGEEKGVYYIQVTVDDQLFTEPILKVE